MAVPPAGTGDTAPPYLGILEHNLSAEETAELARSLQHATADPLAGLGHESVTMPGDA